MTDTEKQGGGIGRPEDEVLTKVLARYSSEELSIVSGILVPHFRERLAEVYAQFNQPVVPGEIDNLFASIDRMLEENGVLLDVDGLFKPVADGIRAARDEISKALREQFYQHCREILAGHGVVDRQGLLDKGSVWFARADFSQYGKGNAFAGKILGRVLRGVYVADFSEIADVLFV
ncbi:hypothetical protein A3I58_00875 [Candidatus Peregrinibacteria bacterium RIFCSPLOWO2_02_FULL_39_10]|nr:MAG: hypothetical protein A3I58_00875 [Candidatus Peregrinibacteria bacterium RIFCSPLOWO2_02_FULL_39_10]